MSIQTIFTKTPDTVVDKVEHTIDKALDALSLPSTWSRALVLGSAVAIAGAGSACQSVTPGPNEEAVLVKKPMLAGSGGIDPTTVKTGREYVALTTDSVMMPTIAQRFSEQFDDINSADNIPVDMDLTFKLKSTNNVKMLSEKGPNWYDLHLREPFRAIARQEVKQFKMMDLTTSETTVGELQKKIYDKSTEYMKSIDIPAALEEVTIGKVVPQK